VFTTLERETAARYLTLLAEAPPDARGRILRSRSPGRPAGRAFDIAVHYEARKALSRSPKRALADIAARWGVGPDYIQTNPLRAVARAAIDELVSAAAPRVKRRAVLGLIDADLGKRHSRVGRDPPSSAEGHRGHLSALRGPPQDSQAPPQSQEGVAGPSGPRRSPDKTRTSFVG
jgi:hypothetical protein